jgi:hypothetical protein
MNLLKQDELQGKAKMLAIINSVTDAVDNGEVKPIEAVITLCTFEKAIEQAKKLITPAVIDEITKYGKKAEMLGCELSLMEGGAVFEFDNCGDNHLIELMKTESNIKEEIKKRKDFLKAIPIDGTTIVDEETGETFKLFPPTKKSTSTFRFAFSK